MQWLLTSLIVLVLMVALLQLLLLSRARRREAKVSPPLHEVLPDGVTPQQRMLLYFYSEHCGACRHLTPLIDDLGRERDGVVKVDVRRNIDTARRFGIKVTPSLVVVHKGLITRTHTGAISNGGLQKFYDGSKS